MRSGSLGLGHGGDAVEEHGKDRAAGFEVEFLVLEVDVLVKIIDQNMFSMLTWRFTPWFGDSQLYAFE